MTIYYAPTPRWCKTDCDDDVFFFQGMPLSKEQWDRKKIRPCRNWRFTDYESCEKCKKNIPRDETNCQKLRREEEGGDGGLKESGQKIWADADPGGCAMSHKVIWEVAAGRKELALVLEDDAVILPSFRDRIPLIVAELPETWDILYLGSGQYEIETAISPHLARPSRIFGLFGYVINWRGAERLLKRVFPLRYQIDTELWRNFSTLDPLLAVPFIVGENKERSDVQISPLAL